ncbi:growth arrest and DNA damage-inducible protein GADD45 beta [Microcaecilia unicolor]|uniref:Growth arrest and DNA damage-inducible protein GADD45 beta n=1 Tax=Microcaecilia unicolor TaxID=1415580 RepID=A0A6P7Z5N5_9AMPH|nr:growth arrest and DNA damage-inducible protein GADD45 beta [Microcaecilia unicolor]
MTLEEIVSCDNTAHKMRSVSKALEELLVAAKRQDSLTVGVYESAKLMNVDPDSVVLCLLAIDDEENIALQIHFTLIQSFCCENDINIVRVCGLNKLSEILGELENEDMEPRDLHCILVTKPCNDSLQSEGLEKVAHYCEECRCKNQWVPHISLLER